MKSKKGLVPIQKMVTTKSGTHVQTFWIAPEDLKKHKESTAESTEDMHKKDGVWSAEREKLHEQIIDKVVNSCPKPPPGEKPTAVLLLGGAASGKSTVVNKYVKPKMGDQFGTINVDDVKESIPEYNKFITEDVGTAASRVHEESSDLGKAITTQVIEDGRNFIYDAVLGSPQKAKELIKKLKDKGYKVSLVGVNVDAEESLSRASLRAFGDKEKGGDKPGSGRMVPADILLHGHKGASQTFEEIHDMVDDVSLYDNNVPPGTDPIPVLSGPPKEVHRDDLYNQFKSKAELKVEDAVARYQKGQIKKAIELIPDVEEVVLEKAILEEINPIKREVYKNKLEKIKSNKA